MDFYLHRLKCLEQLIQGRVDLGVFQPEDLYLASRMKGGDGSENLVITNEFRLYTEREWTALAFIIIGGIKKIFKRDTANDKVYFRLHECECTDEHEFDMVALVSNSPDVEINSLADLRGKRLCHPGFDDNGWLNDLSEIFLQVKF